MTAAHHIDPVRQDGSARSDEMHVVCDDCIAAQPRPLLALCATDLSDDEHIPGHTRTTTCAVCADIADSDTFICPGCGATWGRKPPGTRSRRP